MANVYWYYGGVNTLWATAGNWWSNVGHTTPNGASPSAGDSVYLLGSQAPSTAPTISLALVDASNLATNWNVTGTLTVTGTITMGNAAWQHIWQGTGTSATGNFYGVSYVFGAGTLAVGNFYDSSYVDATCTLTGTQNFYNTSHNSGTLSNATFTDSAYNGGTIGNSCVFNGGSANQGTVNCAAYFNGSSSMNGGNLTSTAFWAGNPVAPCGGTWSNKVYCFKSITLSTGQTFQSPTTFYTMSRDVNINFTLSSDSGAMTTVYTGPSGTTNSVRLGV